MDTQPDNCDEVRRLLEEHVPGVANGVIEIKGIARARGKRVIVTVWSTDERVDPVGSCVGQKGIRVRTIMRHLPGEKIDIVRWSDSLKTLLVNLLAPIHIDDVFVQDSVRQATIFTDFDGKQLIVGPDGLRLKLVSQLVGWELRVETG